MLQGVQLAFPDDSPERSSGCYALSLLQAALVEGGGWSLELSTGQILEFDQYQFLKGYIAKDMTVQDAFRAYELYFWLLYRRGTRFNSIYQTAMKPCNPMYIEVLDKPGFRHFRLNVMGATWDPLPPGRNGADAYAVTEYRQLLAKWPLIF